jgi:hypothetical protein
LKSYIAQYKKNSLKYKGGDPLTMAYLDNFDNRSLNKYEKKFKNKKPS